MEFRLFLQQELVRRCQANPKYSLRSFAKFLGIEPSRLSKILRGQRPIRGKLLSKLGLRLGLSISEVEGFAQQESARKKKIRVSAPNAARQAYVQLSHDTFRSIEDWRHYAILELMKVRGFEPNVKWIAKALGVTASEARAYVERLERVNLLGVQPDGSWVDRTEGFSTHILSDHETTDAHRRSQKEILRKAIDAVDLVPIERRDQSSMMMATHSSKVREAKRRIKEFRQSLCDFLEDTEIKDTVYQLSVSLFPLVEEGPELKEGK